MGGESLLSNVVNAVYQMWRNRRVVRVTLGTAIPTMGSDLGPSFMFVTVTNVGHRNVTVQSIGIRMPNGRHFPGGLQLGDRFGLRDTMLPVKLADGDSATVYFPYRGVAERLGEYYPDDKRVKLKPTCTDSAGREHSGKPWKLTPDELANRGRGERTRQP